MTDQKEDGQDYMDQEQIKLSFGDLHKNGKLQLQSSESMRDKSVRVNSNRMLDSEIDVGSPRESKGGEGQDVTSE